MSTNDLGKHEKFKENMNRLLIVSCNIVNMQKPDESNKGILFRKGERLIRLRTSTPVPLLRRKGEYKYSKKIKLPL